MLTGSRRAVLSRGKELGIFWLFAFLPALDLLHWTLAGAESKCKQMRARRVRHEDWHLFGEANVDNGTMAEDELKAILAPYGDVDTVHMIGNHRKHAVLEARRPGG